MNDFVARKFGEVLAFAETFNNTVELGRQALGEELSPDEIKQLESASTDHASQIKQLVEAAGVSESTNKKAEATNAKLRQMRDLYIGDKWDELTEIYEWLGFYTGAAIVHWELIMGAGDGLGNAEVTELAGKAQGFYEDLMNRSKTHLAAVGKRRQGD